MLRLVLGILEETLKWGEPAYIANGTIGGTTIRIDWKEKTLIYLFLCELQNVFD